MKAWLTSALGAGFLFFQLGYGFENGDQLQYLLLPYRSIYPQFLPGDWFTWQTEHYHVTYAWIVEGLHALSGEAAFPYAMLLAQLATLTVLCFAILRVSHALRYGLVEAALALLVFGCVREAGIAGSLLNHGRLLPADLALPPFLLACASWAESRGAERWSRGVLMTGAWLGVSGFFHANFAVLGPLVLGPLVLEDSLRTRRFAPLLGMTGLYTLLASPTLLLIARSFLSSDRAPAAIAITLFVRSPHHYDLASIDPADFCWPLFLLCAGIPSWFARSAERGTRLRLLVATFAVVSLAFLGASLHSITLDRLFAWRMSVPMLLLLLLAFGETTCTLWRARREDPVALAWLLACIASVGMFAREDLALVATPLALRCLPIAAGALALVFAARASRTRNVLVAACAVLSLAFFAQVAVAPLCDVNVGKSNRSEIAHWPHLLGRRIELRATQRELYEHIRKWTPSDARFLVPPGLIDFRIAARRAVFVDWKCAPMRGDEALEWKRRMLAAMGTRDFPIRGYQLRRAADALYGARPLAELAALARAEGMTYFIAATSKYRERAPFASRVFGDRLYTVYALEPLPAANRPGG